MTDAKLRCRDIYYGTRDHGFSRELAYADVAPSVGIEAEYLAVGAYMERLIASGLSRPFAKKKRTN